MRKVKKVFAALLLLFVANTLVAQSETYTLKGNLKDANDGAMMPYTNCVLLHSTDSVFAYGVTSDDKGAFFSRALKVVFTCSVSVALVTRRIGNLLTFMPKRVLEPSN